MAKKAISSREEGRATCALLGTTRITYSLMTATASEDDRSYYVCGDRAKLISSVLRLSAKIGSKPSPDKDSSGRDFIYICGITFIPDKVQEDLKELYSVLEKFFHIYDTCDLTSSDTVSEMQEIYSTIAPDESKEDAYLSDGVWLSSDGQLHNRGR